MHVSITITSYLFVLCISVFPDVITGERRGWCKPALVLLQYLQTEMFCSPFSQESAHPLTRLSVVVTHTNTSVKCYISLVFITKLLVLWMNYVPVLMWRSADGPSVTWRFISICQTLVLCVCLANVKHFNAFLSWFLHFT